MGEVGHLVQRGGAWAGSQTRSVPTIILLYNGLLLCVLIVALNWLTHRCSVLNLVLGCLHHCLCSMLPVFIADVEGFRWN